MPNLQIEEDRVWTIVREQKVVNSRNQTYWTKSLYNKNKTRR